MKQMFTMAEKMMHALRSTPIRDRFEMDPNEIQCLTAALRECIR